jgi:hypothetical protein
VTSPSATIDLRSKSTNPTILAFAYCENNILALAGRRWRAR